MAFKRLVRTQSAFVGSPEALPVAIGARPGDTPVVGTVRTATAVFPALLEFRDDQALASLVVRNIDHRVALIEIGFDRLRLAVIGEVVTPRGDLSQRLDVLARDRFMNVCRDVGRRGGFGRVGIGCSVHFLTNN
jgi:hypothetical protein